jgi:hypothetical protein
MVKIKTYKIAKRGLRGLSISLPLAWIQDMGLRSGDKIAMFRDNTSLVLEKEGAA